MNCRTSRTGSRELAFSLPSTSLAQLGRRPLYSPSWASPRHPRSKCEHATTSRTHQHRHCTLYMTSTTSPSPSPSLTEDDVLLPADLPLLSASLANKTAVVTGGTGLVGKQLINQLIQFNITVYSFARDRSRAFHKSSLVHYVAYDASDSKPLSDAAVHALSKCDFVINLAGEPIDNGRWTSDRKSVLYKSRVTGTSKLLSALNAISYDRETQSQSQSQSQIPPQKTFINISAVGRYSTSETQVYTEFNTPKPIASDFLSILANDWEKALLDATPSNDLLKLRKVVIRSGVILAPDGGIMDSMLPMFKAFLGGPPGSGKQWLSWIHVHDTVRLILYSCADTKYQGVYNGTSPKPVRLNEFCQILGRVMKRPSWLPVPKVAINLVLGSEAAQLVLKGQCVMPRRTQQHGFTFKYINIQNALEQLLK